MEKAKKYLSNKKLQFEYEETGEYKMYFAVDVPKVMQEYANEQSKSKDLEILELEKAIEIHEEGYLLLDKEYEKLKLTIKNK